MKFIIILLLTITSFSQNKLYSIETQLKQLFEEILDSLEINENNNKCKNDLTNKKFTILKSYSRINKWNQNWKKYIKSNFCAISKLSFIDGLLSDCRLLYFISECKSVITGKGRKKSAEKIFRNKKKLWMILIILLKELKIKIILKLDGLLEMWLELVLIFILFSSF